MRTRAIPWSCGNFAGPVTTCCAPTVLTTYGYALALALSGELVIFELEPNLERLARKACRLERRLLARGWMRAGTH